MQPFTTRYYAMQHKEVIIQNCIRPRRKVNEQLSSEYVYASKALQTLHVLLKVIPPSHRRRGATAVLVRHKPQWHRHDRRGSTVVPSLIVVAPRKTVKTADLRGGTAATFNMFRRASAVLVPSHRGRGATAVLVRHKPHWHRHDRRGSAVVPSVIAVAPRKTVKIADLCGGTAETLNMFKTSAGHRGLGQSAGASPRHRNERRVTAVAPP